jgi:hypothetical protein
VSGEIDNRDEIARLQDELALWQDALVATSTAILTLARDPARRPGAFLKARLDLNVAIRARRGLITACLSLPATSPDCEATRAAAIRAKNRLQDIAVRVLGHWPAARMEAEPDALATSLDKLLPLVVALSKAEVAAVRRHLAAASAAPLPLHPALR